MIFDLTEIFFVKEGNQSIIQGMLLMSSQVQSTSDFMAIDGYIFILHLPQQQLWLVTILFSVMT
jgi:hypothetical protein